MEPLKLVIIGLPNVGKSSVINAIKSKCRNTKGGRAMVGGNPGTTRGQSHFQVWDDPLAVLVDTPGVMMPKVDHQIDGLKLALLGIMRDGLIQPVVLADFLLYVLHSFGAKKHLELWKIPNEVTDIHELLDGIMAQSGAQTHEAAAKKLIGKFRKGELGTFMLDDVGT
jgi:mitochondrial GTPase 1